MSNDTTTSEEVSPDANNIQRDIVLTNGDMGFISDMLAGASTPACLVHIGNFMNWFLGTVTAYQEKLSKIEAEQNAEYLAMGKEFFVLDEQGRPTMKEDGTSYILVDGKTDEDLKEYNVRATNITNHFTEKRNELANEIQVFSVSESVLYNFQHEFLRGINIDQAQKNMQIKPENSGNFVAILYSISQKVLAL